MNRRRVVITGIGAITPLGNSVSHTWENALAGKSGVGPITSFDASEFSCKIAAHVKDFDPESVVDDKKDLRRYDRFSLLGLAAAKEAWQSAGLNDATYPADRMGVVLGVGIGGLPVLEANHASLIADGPKRVSPFLIPAMITNLAPGHIAIKYNLQGVNFTITSACASATHAIGEAARMVALGVQDLVVSGGTESSITPLGIAGFARMRALSTRNEEPQKASRPFDRDRDGFVMGEGAGILILEALDNALARGAQILAEVVGYGFSCDAFHITAPPEGGDGACQSMLTAIKDAGVSTEEIDYINAHGTSTPANDKIETLAIKKVIGEQHCKEKLLVSSTKSMTGHLLGAAGGIEAVFCVGAVRSDVVPPTINLDNPDDGCDLDYVPNTARQAQVKYAMSNSFGFGGTNATIIIKKFGQE